MRRRLRTLTSWLALGAAVLAFSSATLITQATAALAGKPGRVRPDPTPVPFVISGNPFSWPSGVVPLDARTGADQKPPPPLETTIPGLVIFAGEQPFAMVHGDPKPLYLGSKFQGATIRAITPFGLRLSDGRVLSAEQAHYTTAGLPANTAQIPAITPTSAPQTQTATPTPAPTSSSAVQSLPVAPHSPLPAPYDASPVTQPSPGT